MKITAASVLLLIAIAPLSPLTLTANADLCVWYRVHDNDGHYTMVRECGPEYYAWQTREPRWELYADGDEVMIEFELNPLRPVRWYVTPADDPGRDGDYFVMGGELYAYPW